MCRPSRHFALVATLAVPSVLALMGLFLFSSKSHVDQPEKTLVSRNGLGVLRSTALKEGGSTPIGSAWRNFAIVRNPAEQMSSRMRALIESSLHVKQTGLKFGDAHYMSIGARGVWLVSGRGVTCLVEARTGALQCVTVTEFVTGGIALGLFGSLNHRSSDSRRFALLGVAPDWATFAWVRIGSAVRRIAVRHNIYTLSAAKPIVLDHLDS